jgi:hypothetical protein
VIPVALAKVTTATARLAQLRLPDISARNTRLYGKGVLHSGDAAQRHGGNSAQLKSSSIKKRRLQGRRRFMRAAGRNQASGRLIAMIQ